MTTASALLFDAASGGWRRFADPCRVITAWTAEEVVPALADLEAAVEGEGLQGVGYLAYEAAAAFGLPVHPPLAGLPLLQFGLYTSPQPWSAPVPRRDLPPTTWHTTRAAADFARQVEAIRAAIARGESYQVNLTFPLRAATPGDSLARFLALVQGQRCAGACYLECGRWAIASASPELFFARDGRKLSMRPMKGTMPRGRTLVEDQARALRLEGSPKERAENVMILDMVRNDLGRIADPGTVKVPALFTREKYPTVWQLTSSAEAESDASLAEVMAALFPCASVTGAPKHRTMQLIRDLEERPRGVYCGCVGWLAPGRRARFAVAIRTLLLDREQGRGHYGVGAGITWNSDAASEYGESLAKARILVHPWPTFDLLETLLWHPARGYALQREHLVRLMTSTTYFDIPLDPAKVLAALETAAASLPPRPHRVRLLVDDRGRVRTETVSLDPPPQGLLRVALADRPIAADDPFLYHKTTHRRVYEEARAARPGVDDVLLWNTDGELTEATTANLVAELDGELVTPPVASGLLPGTARARLLAQGLIRERVLLMADLLRCRRLWLVNGVRGWRRVGDVLP